MSSDTPVIIKDDKGSIQSNAKDGEEVQVERTIPVEDGKVKPARYKKCIPTFDPFCCTLGNRNLRTCCIVIGIMELVLCIILIVYLTFEDFKISDTATIFNQDYKNEIEWKNNILHLEQIMWSILCSFLAAGGIALVVGAVKRKQMICLVHSFFASACFLVTFINLILYTVYYAHERANFATVVAFFIILSLALNFLYFAVYSLGLYTQLRDGNGFENAEEEAVDVSDTPKVELDADTTTTESHSHSHRKKRSKMPRRSIMERVERGDFISRPSVYN